MRPASFVSGPQRREDGPSQENAGVDGRVLPSTIRVLGTDESSNVFLLQTPEIHPTKAFDQSFGELPIACGRGDGDGLLRSPGMVPYRTIERQWLARPMPGQEPVLAVLRHLLHAIELLDKSLGLAPNSFSLSDGAEALLPSIHPEHAPDVTSPGCFFLYSLYLTSDI